MVKKQKKTEPLPRTLKRVAVFMLDDRMGDFVLSLPTLARFAVHFEGRADLYVARQHTPLAGLLPPFREIIPYIHQTKKRKSFNQLCGFLGLMLKLPFKRYQAVVFISGRITESTLAVLSLSPRRIALDWARRKGAYNWLIDISHTGKHMAQRTGALLQCIGDTAPLEPIRLRAPATDTQRLETILFANHLGEGQKLAVIHPSAGLAHRCWPKDRFAFVADALVECGMKVCFIGAPGEFGFINEIKNLMEHQGDAFFLAEKLTVLLALFERADLLFSNESGPTHLAATTDIPIVTIFGPTDPECWSPMRKENLTLLSKRELCQCDDPRFCNIDWPCIKNITVEEALHALEEYV
ncbi:MAG: glycosyltransferase family 9 protein [Verrucomicrobiota bacterium]|nr:glycosyltransferase family 9 protein [Verrucomicrobiota bacterium]